MPDSVSPPTCCDCGLLSCNRDGEFCAGYDPRMRLVRTQTIMEGADHCDFRYSLPDGD